MVIGAACAMAGMAIENAVTDEPAPTVIQVDGRAELGSAVTD